MLKLQPKTELLLVSYFMVLLMVILVVAGVTFTTQYLRLKEQTVDLPVGQVVELVYYFLVMIFAIAISLGICICCIFRNRKHVRSNP